VAPILLVVMRFAQGIGVGGEWGGAVLMSVEHAPKGRRGFFGAWPQMGVPAGLLLANAVFWAVQALTSEAAFLAWGWRIPFLASAILVVVGLFIRLKLMESPAFERVKETKTEAAKPIVDVVRKYPREVLVAMGMRVAENGCFYILTVFVLAYGENELGLSEGTMLTGVIIAAAIGLVTVPLWGALSDRVGRKPLYLAGAVITTLWAFPLFGLLNTETPILIWLSIIVGVNLGHDMMYGPQAAYFSELFGTRVRYSGASLGYQLASVFAGGFAPLIATALLAANGGDPTLVALYMMGMGLISVVATLFAHETYQKDVDADEDEERELVRERRFDREKFRETADTR
jgi:MFS family permease